MDAQDTKLDDIARKQLICYGHVKKMGPNAIAKHYDQLET
jgi:hypothetical protein